MWCVDCDYELINLDDARCPECGRAFDADDPSTFKTVAAVANVRSSRISIASAVAGAVTGIAASLLFAIEHTFLRAGIGAVAGTIGGIVAALIAGTLWRERRSGDG